MCSMNNLRVSRHRFLIIMLILMILSIGVHFLHDLQPGHLDWIGSGSGICNGAIHFGITAATISGIVFVVLATKADPFLRLFHRSSRLSVFVPPPIR